MFWEIQRNSNIISLLNKEDLLLEEIIHEENLIHECKAQCTKLINYLKSHENIDKLLTYFLTSPEEKFIEKNTYAGNLLTKDLELAYELSHIASEILTSDNHPIYHEIVHEPKFVNKLIKYFENDKDPVIIKYVSRLLTQLVSFSPNIMLQQLYENQFMLYMLNQSLNSSSYIDLIIHMASKLETDKALINYSQWFVNQRYIENLLSYLNPYKQDDLIHDSVFLIFSEIFKNSTSLDYLQPGNIPDKLLPLVLDMLSVNTMEILMRYAFPRNVLSLATVAAHDISCQSLGLKDSSDHGSEEIKMDVLNSDAIIPNGNVSDHEQEIIDEKEDSSSSVQYHHQNFESSILNALKIIHLIVEYINTNHQILMSQNNSKCVVESARIDSPDPELEPDNLSDENYMENKDDAEEEPPSFDTPDSSEDVPDTKIQSEEASSDLNDYNSSFPTIEETQTKKLVNRDCPDTSSSDLKRSNNSPLEFILQPTFQVQDIVTLDKVVILNSVFKFVPYLTPRALSTATKKRGKCSSPKLPTRNGWMKTDDDVNYNDMMPNYKLSGILNKENLCDSSSLEDDNLDMVFGQSRYFAIQIIELYVTSNYWSLLQRFHESHTIPLILDLFFSLTENSLLHYHVCEIIRTLYSNVDRMPTTNESSSPLQEDLERNVTHVSGVSFFSSPRNLEGRESGAEFSSYYGDGIIEREDDDNATALSFPPISKAATSDQAAISATTDTDSFNFDDDFGRNATNLLGKNLLKRYRKDIVGGKAQNPNYRILEQLFLEYDLPSKIVEAWDENEVREDIGLPRRGYMGHLIEISNIIQEQDSVLAPDDSLFTNVEPSISQRWTAFVEGPLDKINSVRISQPAVSKMVWHDFNSAGSSAFADVEKEISDNDEFFKTTNVEESFPYDREAEEKFENSYYMYNQDAFTVEGGGRRSNNFQREYDQNFGSDDFTDFQEYHQNLTTTTTTAKKETDPFVSGINDSCIIKNPEKGSTSTTALSPSEFYKMCNENYSTLSSSPSEEDEGESFNDSLISPHPPTKIRDSPVSPVIRFSGGGGGGDTAARSSLLNSPTSSPANALKKQKRAVTCYASPGGPFGSFHSPYRQNRPYKSVPPSPHISLNDYNKTTSYDDLSSLAKICGWNEISGSFETDEQHESEVFKDDDLLQQKLLDNTEADLSSSSIAKSVDNQANFSESTPTKSNSTQISTHKRTGDNNLNINELNEDDEEDDCEWNSPDLKSLTDDDYDQDHNRHTTDKLANSHTPTVITYASSFASINTSSPPLMKNSPIRYLPLLNDNNNKKNNDKLISPVPLGIYLKNSVPESEPALNSPDDNNSNDSIGGGIIKGVTKESHHEDIFFLNPSHDDNDLQRASTPENEGYILAAIKSPVGNEEVGIPNFKPPEIVVVIPNALENLHLQNNKQQSSIGHNEVVGENTSSYPPPSFFNSPYKTSSLLVQQLSDSPFSPNKIFASPLSAKGHPKFIDVSPSVALKKKNKTLQENNQPSIVKLDWNINNHLPAEKEENIAGDTVPTTCPFPFLSEDASDMAQDLQFTTNLTSNNVDITESKIMNDKLTDDNTGFKN